MVKSPYQPLDQQECECGVCKYPWNDITRFTLESKGNKNTPMHILFDRNIYDLSIKYLSKNKTFGQENISNSILKNMPHRFHNLLFLFFQHCYKQKTIPQSLKTSNTIQINNKGNSSHLFNHYSIALANMIYKLFTSTLTSILSAYREFNQILHNSQKGFRQERCTSRQIQMLIVTLEDSKFSSQGIYTYYI